MIPQEIQDKIESMFPDRNDYIDCQRLLAAKKGYSLAQQTIKDKDAEIERIMKIVVENDQKLLDKSLEIARLNTIIEKAIKQIQDAL